MHIYVSIDEILTECPDVWLIYSIVIPKIKAKWNYVAFSMGYKIPAVNAFQKDAHNNSEDACFKFLCDWLETNNGVTPKNWSTLVDRIKAVDSLYTEAENIEKELIKELMKPTNF